MEDIICIICENGEHEDRLMLCDGCNRGFHTFCLNLSSIVVGNWYCSKCLKDNATKFKLNPRSIVHLYERISTKGQDNIEFGRVGLDTQNTMLLRFSSDNGLIIGTTIRETESAYKVNEKRQRSIVSLINGIKKNECILVYSVSRFSRNVKEGLQLLELLKNKEAYVFSVTENIYSFEDRFVNFIQNAENESTNLGLKIKTANTRIRNLGGHIGIAPFGFTVFRDSAGIRKLQKMPQEQNVIDIVKNGTPNSAMVCRLNAIMSNRGKKWTLGSAKRLHQKYNHSRPKKIIVSAKTTNNSKIASMSKFVDDLRIQLTNCENLDNNNYNNNNIETCEENE